LEGDRSNAYKILGRINYWKNIFCKPYNVIGGSLGLIDFEDGTALG
jgi:hypothetical protein